MHGDGAGDGGVSARLPYERPQLGRVRLEADQVLTTGCKLSSGDTNKHVTGSCAATGSCNYKTGS
jgi:hypothetical protein